MADLEKVGGKLSEEDWGSARIPEGKDFDKTEWFRVLAWALAIPTPNGLQAFYETNLHNGQDGVVWMTNRLKQMCALTRAIWAHAKRLNEGLHDQLVEAKGRKGPWGDVDEENVPDSYYTKIAAAATPTGWAAPRLLDLLHKESSKLNNPVQDMSAILDDSIRESDTSEMFLCKLSERIFTVGKIPPIKIIDLVLKKHKRDEENNQYMYNDVIDGLKDNSPLFWAEVEEIYSKKLYKKNKKDKKIPGWVQILNEYYLSHQETKKDKLRCKKQSPKR